MACDVQTLRDQASCMACSASSHELLAMAVVIACNINASIPMACDIASLKNESRCLACSVSSDRELLAMLVEQLCALSNTGGTGGIAVEGENYCFSGLAPNLVLKIKNLDTALANRIDTVGANPVVDVKLSDGSAC